MKRLLIAFMFIVLSISSTAALAEHNHSDADVKEFCKNSNFTKLNKNDQELLKQFFENGHKQRMASFDKIKKLHDQKKAILVSRKFDHNAYIEKQEQIDNAINEMKTAKEGRFADLADKLSQDGRKVLAECIEKHMHRHHYQHDKDHNHKWNHNNHGSDKTDMR